LLSSLSPRLISGVAILRPSRSLQILSSLALDLPLLPTLLSFSQPRRLCPPLAYPVPDNRNPLLYKTEEILKVLVLTPKSTYLGTATPGFRSDVLRTICSPSNPRIEDGIEINRSIVRRNQLTWYDHTLGKGQSWLKSEQDRQYGPLLQRTVQ
jgi:hypothetical protein